MIKECKLKKMEQMCLKIKDGFHWIPEAQSGGTMPLVSNENQLLF